MVGDETAVDLACDVALQAPNDVLLGEPLGGSSCDVVDGWLVPSHAHDHRPVDRRVRLTVSSAIEPVAIRDA